MCVLDNVVELVSKRTSEGKKIDVCSAKINILKKPTNSVLKYTVTTYITHTSHYV